jgi:ubiquinone/menaquinone biosynthesis C-methylase UbiE
MSFASSFFPRVGRDIERDELPLGRPVTRLIRRHRWMPVLTVLVAAALLVYLLVVQTRLPWELGGAACVLVAGYFWGYAARAFQRPLWPPLSHLRRRQYSEVWDSLASCRAEAPVAAAGRTTEDQLHRSGAQVALRLIELLSISANDDVLEIGCGVGRIGLELGPQCRSWVGADISRNMLTWAEDRLQMVPNTKLVLLGGVGLRELPDRSFDVVYATNMMAHLDEIDRWFYVKDAFRVLREGGRIWIDNIDLESDEGWTMFVNDAGRYQHLERPPYLPRFSTAGELQAYAARAGFKDIVGHRQPPLVAISAVKVAR